MDEELSPTNTMNRNRKVNHVDNENSLGCCQVPIGISPPMGQGE